jgi:DNA-binding XRE family transcriptional regulator
MIRVRATKLGFDGVARRRVGDVFTIRSEAAFSATWMERVPDDTPKVEPASLSQQLTALRKEAKWTVDELAEEVDVDKTNVLDHLSGKTKPRRRNRRKYEEVFSAKLGRPVKLDD